MKLSRSGEAVFASNPIAYSKRLIDYFSFRMIAPSTTSSLGVTEAGKGMYIIGVSIRFLCTPTMINSSWLDSLHAATSSMRSSSCFSHRSSTIYGKKIDSDCCTKGTPALASATISLFYQSLFFMVTLFAHRAGSSVMAAYVEIIFDNSDGT